MLLELKENPFNINLISLIQENAISSFKNMNLQKKKKYFVASYSQLTSSDLFVIECNSSSDFLERSSAASSFSLSIDIFFLIASIFVTVVEVQKEETDVNQTFRSVQLPRQ